MSYMSVEVSQKSKSSVGLTTPKGLSPSSGRTVLADVSDGSIGQAPKTPDESRKHHAPTKHNSMLTAQNGVQAPTKSHPNLNLGADIEGSLVGPSGASVTGRKKNVGKSISSMFKGLFKNPTGKQPSDAGVPDLGNTKSSPNMANIMQANGSTTSSNKASFSLKAVFNSFSAGPDNSSTSSAGSKSDSKLQVQASAKSSTAAIESEVQAAMRRAASITGRQHAPSTLLAVAKDLPPKMARPVWNLRDYAVVEKMYTGESLAISPLLFSLKSAVSLLLAVPLYHEVMSKTVQNSHASTA